MALPNKAWLKDGDEPPFNVYAPDPRRTFVVYNSDVDERPVMNVTYATQKNGDVAFTVYTHTHVYVLYLLRLYPTVFDHNLVLSFTWREVKHHVG